VVAGKDYPSHLFFILSVRVLGLSEDEELELLKAWRNDDMRRPMRRPIDYPNKVRNMCIELRRAMVQTEMGPRECHLCKQSFVAESVLAAECYDGQSVCPTCVEYFGERNPETCPTIEEYKEANQRYTGSMLASPDYSRGRLK
jgi:hypothetical protein